MVEVPLSTDEALEYLQYITILETVQHDLDMIVAATRIHQKHFISFRDALILQVAKTAGCSLLVSEDLQDGFCLDNLVLSNPFES